MRVLVTGGAGFIGSHLCDAFHARGDAVSVIDDLSHGRASRLPEGISLYKESVLNASRLSALAAEIRPDLICHLAAQVDVRVSVADPAKDAEAKSSGLSTCSRRRVPWMLVSSSVPPAARFTARTRQFLRRKAHWPRLRLRTEWRSTAPSSTSPFTTSCLAPATLSCASRTCTARGRVLPEKQA